MTKEMDNSFHLTETIYLHQGVLQLPVNQNCSQRGLNRVAPGAGQSLGLQNQTCFPYSPGMCKQKHDYQPHLKYLIKQGNIFSVFLKYTQKCQNDERRDGVSCSYLNLDTKHISSQKTSFLNLTAYLVIV